MIPSVVEYSHPPFDGEISRYRHQDPIQQGDKVKIHGLSGYEDPYEIIVGLRFQRKKYHFPICEIEALDESSENQAIIDAYCQWLLNR